MSDIDRTDEYREWLAEDERRAVTILDDQHPDDPGPEPPDEPPTTMSAITMPAITMSATRPTTSRRRGRTRSETVRCNTKSTAKRAAASMPKPGRPSTIRRFATSPRCSPNPTSSPATASKRWRPPTRIMLSAQYKAGKSTLTGNLIRALVDGETFLGQFAVNTPASGVVLIDDEMSENTLRSWLRVQNIDNTEAVADVITLRGNVTAFNLLDEHCHAAWVQRLADVGCDYLILDCLRPVLDCLGLDEHRDAGRFLVALDALLNEAGIRDALLIQHMATPTNAPAATPGSKTGPT